LIRLEPFTTLARDVYGRADHTLDHADRLFHSVAEAWTNSLHDTSDVKELTPEWFYCPSFLINTNHIDLGTRQNGDTLNHVVLPPYATTPLDFIVQHATVRVCAHNRYRYRYDRSIVHCSCTSRAFACHHVVAFVFLSIDIRSIEGYIETIHGRHANMSLYLSISPHTHTYLA
jgi:hypothetical protein